MNDITLHKSDFEINTLDDEVRVDGLCRDLLLRFYDELREESTDPELPTELARSADYYLRDFVIGFKQWNLLDENRSPVRGFAGNWYIINTLEPSSHELARHLSGILAFYRFLHRHDAVSDHFLSRVEQECGDHTFYEERLRSFWEIQGDGYYEWERGCSLRER